MIVEFSVLDTELYSIEHILDSQFNETLIKNFETNDNSRGLEFYLKDAAFFDEENNLSRTYLIKDKATQELAGYFSLRTGLITRQIEDEKFDSIPALELANFAINTNYKKNHPNIKLLGFYIFKNFIPKSVNEKSFLAINCISHAFIYNPSMFHSMYTFLYKDVTFMNKNFTHYKLFMRISKHKFDKENKVILNINIANHKVIFPYVNNEHYNYNNEEKLEINLGDVDIKSSDQYNILVENISVDFIDKNLVTHQIIKNFDFTLNSSFDLNSNKLKLKSIEIQSSLYLLQTILHNSRNFSALTKPEEIWKIKIKNKSQIFDNSIKRGFLFYKTKENKWVRFYSLLSGGYIYLFEKSGNANADYLIPLYDSYIEDVYYNNNVDNLNYGFNIIFGDKNVNDEKFNKIKEASYIMERGYTDTSSKVFDILNKTSRKL